MVVRSLILEETEVVVRVVDEFTGLGHGALAGAHTAYGESASDQVIAEGDECSRQEAEELHHHVTGDAHLALMGSPEDARKTLRQW